MMYNEHCPPALKCDTNVLVVIDEKVYNAKIAGLANNYQPFIGWIYIVEITDEKFNKKYYPYTHCVIPQYLLKEI